MDCRHRWWRGCGGGRIVDAGGGVASLSSSCRWWGGGLSLSLTQLVGVVVAIIVR